MEGRADDLAGIRDDQWQCKQLQFGLLSGRGTEDRLIRAVSNIAQR